jgi:hypothetical protein
LGVSVVLSHKRGDSWQQVVTIPTAIADGFFVGWTPACQVRKLSDNTLVSGATCVWVNALTTRELTVTVLDTSAWPEEHLEFDIEFTRTSDGFVMSTETARIAVRKDITQ